jgi:hypothetical protein
MQLMAVVKTSTVFNTSSCRRHASPAVEDDRSPRHNIAHRSLISLIMAVSVIRTCATMVMGLREL